MVNWEVRSRKNKHSRDSVDRENSARKKRRGADFPTWGLSAKQPSGGISIVRVLNRSGAMQHVRRLKNEKERSNEYFQACNLPLRLANFHYATHLMSDI